MIDKLDTAINLYCNRSNRMPLWRSVVSHKMGKYS